MAKEKKQLEVKPWHAREDESTLKYAMFRLYLEMGEERTLGKTVDVSGRSYGVVAFLSMKYKWAERAKAYDAHCVAIEEAAAEKALATEGFNWGKRRSQFREREYQVAQLLMDKVWRLMQLPETEVVVHETKNINGTEVATVTTIQPVKWTGSSMIQAMKAASEVSRLAIGMETSRSVHTVEENPEEKRFQSAKALYDHWVKNVDVLVDDELAQNPNQDRLEVRGRILASLPSWLAESWKLTPKQIPLLTTSLPNVPADALALDDDIQTIG